MTDGTKVSAGNKRRVQVRKERKDGFTAAKRQVFFDHLAACCNVTRAAEAAGVSTVAINYHRRRDPEFAQAMSEAFDCGYANLEASMIERAAGGGGYVPGPDAQGAPGPEAMDTMLGLHLLQLRRKPLGTRTGRAGYAPRAVSVKALNESLLAKLEVLARRLTLRRGSGRALKRHEVRKLKNPKDVPAA